MPKRRVLFLLAIIFCVVAANRLANVSGSDWPPIKPEELNMTGVPQAPGAPSISSEPLEESALFAIQGPAGGYGTLAPRWGNPPAPGFGRGTPGDPESCAGPRDPASGADPRGFCGAIRLGGGGAG